jgi:hypothetical protein
VTTKLEADPFATSDDLLGAELAASRSRIITAGRYRLPNLDGSPKKGGWQRVTNLVSAFSDQFGLRMWEIEQILIAYTINPEETGTRIASLMRLVQTMTKANKRGEIESFLSWCKDIAGGNEGANFGNNRHELVEADHLAIPTAAPDGFARQHLYLYRAALVRNELNAVPAMQERRVLVEELEAVGTLDNVLEDLRLHGLHIADLKTQKRFWTWLEIAAQLACYANAVAYWEPADPKNPRAGKWVPMPAVSKTVGMVLWMPKEHPSGTPAVDVYEVDIEAGWKTAKLAREVVLDRAGGKRAKEPRAWLRKAAPVTLTEQYAARFAAVESRTEGSALVAEAKARGVWDAILAGEAQTAMKRLEKVPG